jgi:hypothetical protein
MAHVENYSRVVKEEGFYKYNRDENVCKVMSVAGAPEEMIKSLKNYKMAWRTRTDKDCFQMVEWFGKTKVVTKSKLGEEVEVPEAAHNNLTTRTGPGKYKMFINMKNGTKEEWNLHFRDSGLDIVSFQDCFRTVLGMFQDCFRTVSGLFQDCFRTVSGLFQDCFSTVLVLFPVSILFEYIFSNILLLFVKL